MSSLPPDPRLDLGRYSHIVVGAGSAGCTLANRLSADPKNSVLLLEAGGSDRYHWVHIPVGYLYCMGNPRTDWGYATEAEAGLNGRRLAYPRGKVMGGCSSINGMIYMRGQAADYDRWRQLGNAGWGWDDVLPLFLKSENHHALSGPFHSQSGELRVEKQRLSWPILDAIREAAEEMGVPPIEDFNRGDNFGSSYFEVTQKAGFRFNAVRAFLAPIRHRKNLRILTQAQAERIRIEEGRATGLDLRLDGRPARAHGEIVLAAGAIGTPQLLQLSGIGPAELLRRHGIDVLLDRPTVGENLQDHLQIRTAFRIEGARTLNEWQATLWGKAQIGLQYALKRSGPMAMAPSQLGIFMKSDPRFETANIEFHVQPLSLDRFGQPLDAFPAITVSVCNLRPESRGSVRITSPDPFAPPAIAPNYLSTDGDREVASASIRAARRLMATRRLERHRPQEFKPGVHLQSDEDLARAAGDIATTIFHPVGTARMGADPDAVVDPQLRLRGIAGLRVADCSIMPTIVSGNTHAPAVMIAEKAAEMILADR
ncbi:choline dehydrogenase [Aureimonas ureilytica]|uniref:Choline dehydrogenase n=1 Tax=Aureimonas ureilytica TaxID=401562 RepID=A0A175RWB8_9HYPH|nr:GMC family oxidoreductase [Aureimonas ureilytica]KTQ95935.1 choline dehydrogenase [Aureimonas ureilytica]KTR07936.1 choline dehydrogenase [Aureimonas ureilytica]